MSSELDRVRSILDSGDFDRLEGEFESEYLECKRQPYRLENDEQKLELAKDVAGLANAQGGIILIGCSTVKDPKHGEDRIERVRPFSRDMCDITRYEQVISDWLWPPFARSRINWFSSINDEEKGIVAIFVPAVEGPERPLLISKTLFDGPRRVEILFGYCERKYAAVRHNNVQRLHGLLRDGMRFDGEIRDGLQSLQSTLESLRSSQLQEETLTRRSEEFTQQLGDALNVVGLNDKPAFTLSAWTHRTLDIRELFVSREAKVVKLLERPPEVRSSGFRIIAGETSRIIKGRLRRVFTEGFRLLELSRSGILIHVAQGDSEGLCWGRHDRQSKWNLINQLALVENTYLFCLLCELAYEGHLQAGDQVVYDLRLLRMSRNGEKCRLEPGPLDRYSSRRSGSAAPEDSGFFAITTAFGAESAARVALRLLAELYSWFGIEEERIPYSLESVEGRIVAKEQLAAID